MITPLKHIVDLFFPTICLGCGTQMQQHRQHVCAICIADLPVTGFENIPNNTVEQIFYGRVSIQAATAWVYFTKQTLIQECLHEIKYQNNQYLAHQLGEVMGKCLAHSQRFSTVDMVIPVPLHSSKLKKRGFNQAERLAKPIADVLNIPLNHTVLIRTENTQSQTNKHRFERWQNMEGNFSVTNAAIISGKHVLLIDDVVTTGATLEASAQELIKYGASVSIAVAAFAHD